MGQAGDAEEVLKHKFFAGLDLEKLLRKEIEPPYVPLVKSASDISNFDAKMVGSIEIHESIVPEENVLKIK